MEKDIRLSRRDFLVRGGLAAMSLGLPRWARAASDAARYNGKAVVVLLLKGGMDGLSAVVPFADKTYAKLRPTIGIPPPGMNGGAIDLDGTFGLHPKLAPLARLYKNGQAAFIVAAGSSDTSRSHFQASDYLSFAVPNIDAGTPGWLCRGLDSLKIASNPLSAVSIGMFVPDMLRGFPVATLKLADEYHGARLGWPFPVRDKQDIDAAIAAAARGLLETQKRLGAITKCAPDAMSHAGYPDAPIGRDLFELARILKADMGTRLGFIESPSWDDHSDEGGSVGAIAQRFELLAQAIDAFYRDLASRAQDVVLLTLTEFGRMVAENGSGGTDHGHASAMMLFGGGVKGGRVYGRWPGLEPGALFEARDVAVTTDFRQVVGEVLTTHLGIDDISAIFPGGPWPPIGLM
jgi:uncharacterized protein (DUF1501 family)